MCLIAFCFFFPLSLWLSNFVFIAIRTQIFKHPTDYFLLRFVPLMKIFYNNKQIFIYSCARAHYAASGCFRSFYVTIALPPMPYRIFYFFFIIFRQQTTSLGRWHNENCQKHTANRFFFFQTVHYCST